MKIVKHCAFLKEFLRKLLQVLVIFVWNIHVHVSHQLFHLLTNDICQNNKVINLKSLLFLLPRQNKIVSGFWSPRMSFLVFFSFLCYETMSNCCVLNDIGLWRFAWCVRPVLATILCIWEIWSGSKNCISRISLVGPPKKACHVTAPTLKPTYDQKPDTFYLALW